MMSKSRIYLLLLLITSLGFGLMLYQLGEDSLTGDEAGQALAALQPTVGEMILFIRGHAMAMPLDYLVSRVFVRLSQTEFVLRLPSVVWGTLALLLVYDLARRLTDTPTALIAAFLFSLSPIHIRYAQEMRFYAALGFFYLLSNITLLKAIERPNLTHWVLFILATLVGAWFHLYVALSVVNGFALWLVAPHIKLKRWIVLFQMLFSGLLLATMIAPGYLYFGAQQQFNFDLFEYGGSIPHILMEGMGWFSFPYTSQTPALGLWEILNMTFAVIGVVTVFKHIRKYPWLVGMIAGVLLNILLILFADLYKGYWFLSRQLVHLAPIAILLTGIGVVSTLEAISRLRWNDSVVTYARYVFPLIAFALTCVAAGQKMSQYYAFEKSQGREIVAVLLLTHQNHEPIFVIPHHQEKIYRFYLKRAQVSDGMLQKITPVDWQHLQIALSGTTTRAYLAVPSMDSIDQLSMLENLEFRPLWEPEKVWYGEQMLWVRETSEDLGLLR
jgi:uncharacterized membrane protein